MGKLLAVTLALFCTCGQPHDLKAEEPQPVESMLVTEQSQEEEGMNECQGQQKLCIGDEAQPTSESIF